jgi:quinol monooxygenase YgiN
MAKTAPLVRMAELEIDPAQLDAYRALLAEEIEASVASEPGVLALSAVAARDDPARVTILEIYAGQAAYEAHLRTPHFLKYKTLTAKMVRSLRLMETTPVALRAKSGALSWP